MGNLKEKVLVIKDLRNTSYLLICPHLFGAKQRIHCGWFSDYDEDIGTVFSCKCHKYDVTSFVDSEVSVRSEYREQGIWGDHHGYHLALPIGGILRPDEHVHVPFFGKESDGQT